MVDVAVMVSGCVPLLAMHPHPWLRARSDLQDRRDRLRGLQLELASDDELQAVPQDVAVLWQGHLVGHRSENRRSGTAVL